MYLELNVDLCVSAPEGRAHAPLVFFQPVLCNFTKHVSLVEGVTAWRNAILLPFFQELLNAYCILHFNFPAFHNYTMS